MKYIYPDNELLDAGDVNDIPVNVEFTPIPERSCQQNDETNSEPWEIDEELPF